jgi:PglD N-terminal domain
MLDIAIIGAGGFGREVEMLIRQINDVKRRWNFIGFLDDAYVSGTRIGNSEVLGPVTEISKYNDTYYVIAIADAIIKKKIVNRNYYRK